MAALGGEPLAMTLKTASEPRGELPPELDDRWDRLAGKADGLTKKIYLEHVGETWKRTYAEHIQVVPIWFNPWQHQQAQLPLVALLQEVRAQFSHLLKFGRLAKKLSQVAVEAGLNLIGEVIDLYSVAQGGPKLGAGKSLGSIRSLGEAYERRNFEGLESAQRLNLLFEEAVTRLLRPNKEARAVTSGGVFELRRLVIFIDDLDRCNDAQTVKLLEAIKLYLQTPYCVFVIGMDGAATRRAVENILPHTRPEEAQEYLEKLFQARVYVPVPHRHEPFIREMLRGCTLTEDTTGIPIIELAESLTRLIEPNPRKLKSFVGSLAIAWQIAHPGAGGEQRKIEFRHFLLIAYLRAYHPKISRLLTHDPQLAITLNAVLTEDAEQPEAESSPVLRFFYRSFRHAFDRASDEEAEAAVGELIDRLDRYRSDRAFLDLWREGFPDAQENIPGLLAPALQVICDDG